LTKEHKLATDSDTKTPFSGYKDELRRLAVFHVFQTRDDDPQHIENGDNLSLKIGWGQAF